MEQFINGSLEVVPAEHENEQGIAINYYLFMHTILFKKKKQLLLCHQGVQKKYNFHSAIVWKIKGVRHSSPPEIDNLVGR